MKWPMKMVMILMKSNDNDVIIMKILCDNDIINDINGNDQW